MRQKELIKSTLYGGIDPVEAVIFLNARYSLLPEIFDIFGREHLMHFIEVFGGKKFVVPPLNEIEKAFQHLAIWSALRKSDTPAVVKRLSARYEIPASEVRAAYRRVQDGFNEQAQRFEAAVETPATIGAQQGNVGPAESETSKSASTPAAPDTSSSDLSDLFGIDEA